MLLFVAVLSLLEGWMLEGWMAIEVLIPGVCEVGDIRGR
jgi:hypothetical protein